MKSNNGLPHINENTILLNPVQIILIKISIPLTIKFCHASPHDVSRVRVVAPDTRPTPLHQPGVSIEYLVADISHPPQPGLPGREKVNLDVIENCVLSSLLHLLGHLSVEHSLMIDVLTK